MALLSITLLIQEGPRGLILTPGRTGVEDSIITIVQWLKLGVETIGAAIIGLGIVNAGYRFIRALIPPQVRSYNRIRLTLARYLALALEFQLGADILSMAISPSWDQIGKLGAIAVIRNTLNCFLTREMRDERESTETEGVGARTLPQTGE